MRVQNEVQDTSIARWWTRKSYEIHTFPLLFPSTIIIIKVCVLGSAVFLLFLRAAPAISATRRVT